MKKSGGLLILLVVASFSLTSASIYETSVLNAVNQCPDCVQRYDLECPICPNTTYVHNWTLTYRGENFEIYTNGSAFQWMSAPHWVLDEDVGYVPYIYERDEAKKCHVVKVGLIASRIYDSAYAEFYDPEMTQLRVKAERFFIDYWDGKNWKEASPGNALISVSEGSMLNLTLTISTTKPSGTFNITYVFNERLKHEIKWVSHESESVIVRVRQVWNLNEPFKVKTDTSLIEQSTKVKSPHYVFMNEADAFLVLENQYSAIEYLEMAEIDLSGKKTTYVFSNWTIDPEEYLTIDPVTTTVQPPSKDSFVSEGSPSTNYGTNSYLHVSADQSDERSFIEWDISGIPTEENIISVFFSLYNDGTSLYPRIYQIHRVTGSWSETGITWYNQPSVNTTHGVEKTNCYWTEDDEFYHVYWTVEITDMFKDIYGSQSSLSVRVKDKNEGQGGYWKTNYFHAKDMGSSVTPRLNVIWGSDASWWHEDKFSDEDLDTTEWDVKSGNWEETGEPDNALMGYGVNDESVIVCNKTMSGRYPPSELKDFQALFKMKTFQSSLHGWDRLFLDDFEDGTLGNWVCNEPTFEVTTGGTYNAHWNGSYCLKNNRIGGSDGVRGSGYRDFSRVTTTLRIDAWVRTGYVAGYYFSLQDYSTSIFSLHFYSNYQKIQWYDGSQYHDTGLGFNGERWNHLEIELNFVSNTVDIWMNGKKGSSCGFRISDPQGATRAWISLYNAMSGSERYSWYWDDIEFLTLNTQKPDLHSVAGFLFHYKDQNNYYLLRKTYDGWLELWKKKSGSLNILANVYAPEIPLTDWSEWVVRMVGQRINVFFIDETTSKGKSRKLYIDCTDSNPIDKGMVGFISDHAISNFDDFKVYEYRVPPEATFFTQFGSSSEEKGGGQDGGLRKMYGSKIQRTQESGRWYLLLNGSSRAESWMGRKTYTMDASDTSINKEIDLEVLMKTYQTGSGSEQVGYIEFNSRDYVHNGISKYIRYVVMLKNDDPTNATLELSRHAPSKTVLSTVSSGKSPTSNVALRISRYQNNILVWLDDTLKINVTDASPINEGGYWAIGSDNATVYVDSIRYHSHARKTWMPYWRDFFFEEGSSWVAGAWDNRIDAGASKSVIQWLNQTGDAYIRMRVSSENLYIGWRGTSVLQGVLEAGAGMSEPYLNGVEFRGYDGSAYLNNEAVIYYENTVSEALPMYLNGDVRLVNASQFECLNIDCSAINPWSPHTNIGFVFQGSIDFASKATYNHTLEDREFTPYDEPPQGLIDVYITIEPQIYSYGYGNETYSCPTICSPYEDSSYHCLEQPKPTTGWQWNERIKFSINLNKVLKHAFEQDWGIIWYAPDGCMNICWRYGYPNPHALGEWIGLGIPVDGWSLANITDHIHMYDVFPYVEACCGDITADFYEMSITTTAKYNVTNPD